MLVDIPNATPSAARHLDTRECHSVAEATMKAHRIKASHAPQPSVRRLTISVPHDVYAVVKTEEARRNIAGTSASMSSIFAEAVRGHLGATKHNSTS